LAKRVSADDHGASLLTGTPYFMSPELFSGQSSTIRSDVYAVGVSYYYLLTGQFPFLDRKLGQLAAKHANEPIPDPRELCPDLPAEVVAVVESCMAKNPADRPEDGEAVHDLLMSVYRRLRDLPSLVGDALQGTDLAWSTEEDAIQIVASLEGGRSQRVRVELCHDGPWQEETVRVYSVCCPVSESYYRRALELNADITHGSIAIETVGGTPCYVMINSYPRGTCDAEEIRRSVLDIAKHADQIEQVLTGEDRF
jgi:serine/threonine-protein kinase